MSRLFTFVLVCLAVGGLLLACANPAGGSTATTYTVTFDSQGGSAVSPITGVVANAVIAAPAAPTRSGYTFDGWFKEAACINRWATADRVNANTILYAKWTAITYTVTFDSQGGSSVAGITGVLPGATITAPTAPTKAGNSFGGWYKEAACTTAWTFTTDTVNTNTPLYAKWVLAAVIPSTSDLVGKWVLSCYRSSSTALDMFAYIFNSDGTQYAIYYEAATATPTTGYSYTKGTWSIDASGALTITQTHQSATYSSVANPATLTDWASNPGSTSKYVVLYNGKLFFNDFSYGVMSFALRSGSGSGIVGTWQNPMPSGLAKGETVINANGTLTATNYTRSSTSAAWSVQSSYSGTYTQNGTDIVETLTGVGTFNCYGVVTDTHLLMCRSPGTGMVKQ
jgi:uncharacterized repeat protein (TIGR02543 family)